ncbi:MAG: S8 family serine peptidase [Candidatus Thorarchaeota archaeon]
MNNLKKAGCLALIAIFALSAAFVPFTPTNSIQPVATPKSTTPDDVLMDIQKYIDTQKEGGPLDSVLASYRDSGYIPNTVSRNDAGEMGAIVTVRTDSDVASLNEIIDVNWKVEIGAMTIVFGHIPSPDAVTAIENFDGIVTAFADALQTEKTTGVEPRPTAEPPQDTPEYAVIPHIGADVGGGVGAYDGTGVTVGVVDTGVDFSVEGLGGTMDIGSDGLSTSYDPTGYGFVVSLYRANATVVDPDAYLDFSSWNVLSYEMGGHWYINWTTCQHGSPYVNNQGGLSNLDWFYDAYMPAWWPSSDPYPGNVSAMNDYYHNVMRQDFEIPEPTTSQGGPQLNITLNATLGTWQMVPYYTTGYAFQQRGDPYLKVFAPVLVLNASRIIVDWNTTRAHTDFWNLNVNYGEWNFSNPAAAAYYNALGDWSFVDDYEAGLMYYPSGAEANLNMYYDYPADGVRFGLGTLCRTWEGNIFGLGMVEGIGLGGRALGIMYDGDSHGTFVSGEIAGQATTYPIGLNGTDETLSGIAPGAKIMGVMSVGIAAEFNSMLYAAGFDYNDTSEYWEWNPLSVHQAQITSNSWGWVAPQYIELWGQYSLIYAAMATPGFFFDNATYTYPGMVQCFSAGNSGPGYGTTTPPRAPQIINVGASTSYFTFENDYGPGQGWDQIADFSSRGPLTLGYPKPDVLAPGRNNYGWVPTYGGTFGITSGSPTAVYAGTSMACPLAAGLAALMLDADDTLTPDMVKVIMQSTSNDIGMDGLAQGHGVIDAAAAIDFVVNNNGYTFYTYDSVANWDTVTTEAWQYDMNPYQNQAFINTTTPPGNFADGNIYFGVVAPGATPTVTVTGDNWISADQTFTATTFEVDTVTTFTFETYVYNETTEYGHDNLRGGWFALDTEMGGAAYANFAAADYATISITGDPDVFAVTGDPLWAFCFDWNDVANPGVVDYYNMTTGAGDELTRWQYAGGTQNVLKMDLSYPGGLSNLFPNTPIILVNDNTIFSNWNQTGDGNILDVTVTTWQLVTDGNLGFAANGDDMDVTLTAPAEFGVHQGFVMINGTHMMPYSYMVYATYDSYGTVLELAEGVGAVRTPYEHGAVTAGWDSYYTARSADHVSFVVDLTNSSVNYLAARINWTSADTDMDVAIIDYTGSELAHSGDAVKSTDDSSLAIAQVDGTTGMYIIYTSVNALDGATIPEDFTLTVVGLATLDEPTLALSWTSRDHASPTTITSGGSAVGDHVEMTATWTDGVNPGMPEFGITTVEMKILYGTLFYQQGHNVIPSDPGGQFSGVIDPDDFAWVHVPGIVEGDNVRITGAFDGGDNDFMAWWNTTPMDARTYANNLVDMASSDDPETDSFTADQSGQLDFGILNYAQDGGDYYLTVDTRLGLEPPSVAGSTKTIDTYYLLANQTYSVLVDSDTGTNLKYSMEIPNIFIGNFFAPDVTVEDAVALANNVFNISWSVTDQNADDVHYYSVWISGDGGVSYQVLARNLTETYYLWDSSGFLERDNYIVRIRAFSLDFSPVLDLLPADHPDGVYDTPLCSVDDEANYWPGDFGDGFTGEFFAGDVPPPEPTTTPTEPTTPTGPTGPTQPVTWDPLLIGLIGGIGVGVVVLLILFLIRKK